MFCDKTKQCTADILIPHESAITLVFRHQQWLVDDAPFRLKFALKVTHPPSENADFNRFPFLTSQNSQPYEKAKSSIMTNRKSATAFQRAIDGVRMLPLSPPNGGSKANLFFVFKIKFNFSRIKFTIKFLYMKTSSDIQNCSCSIIISPCI